MPNEILLEVMAGFSALAASHGVEARVLRRSALYRTRPVPASDQPDFANAVMEIATEAPAATLLRVLHAIEDQYGRQRLAVNGARTLDLDLLDYHGRVDPVGPPILPHPRLADRCFVLCPLAEVAPDWQHPVSGATVSQLMTVAGCTPDRARRWT